MLLCLCGVRSRRDVWLNYSSWEKQVNRLRSSQWTVVKMTVTWCRPAATDHQHDNVRRRRDRSRSLISLSSGVVRASIASAAVAKFNMHSSSHSDRQRRVSIHRLYIWFPLIRRLIGRTALGPRRKTRVICRRLHQMDQQQQQRRRQNDDGSGGQLTRRLIAAPRSSWLGIGLRNREVSATADRQRCKYVRLSNQKDYLVCINCFRGWRVTNNKQTVGWQKHCEHRMPIFATSIIIDTEALYVLDQSINSDS